MAEALNTALNGNGNLVPQEQGTSRRMKPPDVTIAVWLEGWAGRCSGRGGEPGRREAHPYCENIGVTVIGVYKSYF